MLDPETIGKTADATKALAEAAGKGIDASVSLGRVFAGAFRPLLGIVEDRGKFWRWEQLVKLSERAEVVMRTKRMDVPTRELPLKFAIPLLEKASLEDNEELRELWAHLLVNAGDASTPMELRSGYVTVLSELSSFDARNLALLASASLADPFVDRPYLPVIETWHLPVVAMIHEDGPGKTEPPPLSGEITESLGNLFRLGCIAPGGGWGGVALFTVVTVTGFGRALHRACS